jgi:hypothetical protein
MTPPQVQYLGAPTHFLCNTLLSQSTPPTQTASSPTDSTHTSHYHPSTSYPCALDALADLQIPQGPQRRHRPLTSPQSTPLKAGACCALVFAAPSGTSHCGQTSGHPAGTGSAKLPSCHAHACTAAAVGGGRRCCAQVAAWLCRCFPARCSPSPLAGWPWNPPSPTECSLGPRHGSVES